MFSKAKIQRFNEIRAKVSSATSYNVKNKNKVIENKSKVKCAVPPQADRISEKSSSVSEVGSTHGTPCFKTPILSKQKKLPSTTPTVKSKSEELPKEIVDIETLREKIVECENKDAYIKELLEQLEEIKENLYQLEKTKEMLDTDKANFDDVVENMRKKHEINLESVSNEFNSQISELTIEKHKLTDEISQKIRAFEELNAIYQKNIKKCDEIEESLKKSEESHKQYLKEKEDELENKEKELRALEINCIEMQKKHCIEIEKLMREHNLELQDMEFELLKSMTEVQREKENTIFKILEVEEKMKKEILEMQKCFHIEKQSAEEKVKQVEKSMASSLTESKVQQETEEVIKIWKEKPMKKSEEGHKQYLKEREDELENKEKELRALEVNCIEMQNKHCIEIEKLMSEHNLELQDMEFELLKSMTEVQREKENTMIKIMEVEEKMKKETLELQECFQIEKQQIISCAEEKVKQVEKNIASSLIEGKVKEETEKVIKIWKEKLETHEKESQAILRECQAISEYNIIQCEIEKNNVKQCLARKSNELEELQSKYKNTIQGYDELKLKYRELQQEMSKIILELNDTRKTLHDELAKKTKALEQFSKDKTTYEVTIKNSQVTIDVLKKRLIHSDEDVEQLKSELAENEVKMLEYEQKCLQLTAELKASQNFNDELEMQFESDIKLNRTDIEELRKELHQKVDKYRMEGEEYNKKFQETKLLKDEIFQQLQNAFSIVNKLKMELDCLETINSQYEFEIEQSQNELEDYHMREMDWSIVKDKLENTVAQMERLLEERQTEIDPLKKQVAQLQEKIELQAQYTDYYENKVKEYERELSDTGNIHKKYIEMSGKYDELSQKFEQLEMENVENKRKITTLTEELEKKAELNQKYNDRQEAYDNLLIKYESLKNGSKPQVGETENFVETLNDEDSLRCKVHYLENELKEVSQKYADLVGHHNNKQKRRHLIELKTKNDELIQGNMDLDLKLRNHVKIIEKLKKENADLKKCIKSLNLLPKIKKTWAVQIVL